MITHFALIAGSDADLSHETVDRFSRLEQQGGACLQAQTTRLWVSRSDAIRQNDDYLLAGVLRLDNRDELLSKLPFGLPQDTDDLDLAFAICSAFGSGALTMLSGSFALLLWVRQSAQLWVIRDHFGLQPVYLAARGNGLVVASDLKLTAHLNAQPLKPNEAELSAYFCGFMENETQTAFAGIERLPRASKLNWTADAGVQVQSYWQLELPNTISAKQAVPALRNALGLAVRKRAGDPRDTGCMLSGGLDSSSIAVLADPDVLFGTKETQPLRTLSFVYRESDSYDESPFIKSVNDKIGADPWLIKVEGPADPAELVELVDEQFDLCPGPGLLKSRKIYAEASALGLQSLLDGHGGDEVISHGYDYQAELASKGAYLRLWREIRGAARIYGDDYFESYLLALYLYAPWKKRSLLRRLVGRIGRKLATPNQQMVRPVSVLSETYIQDQDIEAREKASVEKYDNIAGPPDERKSHLANVTSPLMSRSFEVLFRSAAAQGIEPRYPFFDKALVEQCLSVPPAAKLREGWSRRVLRDAMEGLLPKDVQWRPDKANFSTEVSNFVALYLADDQRRHQVMTRMRGILDPAAFERCCDVIQTGSDSEKITVTQVLWRSIYLAVWRERLDHWNRRQQEGALW